MSVLKVVAKVLEALEVGPDPVLIADSPLKADARVGLNSLVCADANILLHQHHAVHLGILVDTSEVSHLLSAFLVSDNLVSLKSEEESTSHAAVYVVVGRQTVLHE